MKGSRTRTNEHFKELAEMLLERILSFLPRGKASQSSLAGLCIKHNHQAVPHFFSACTSVYPVSHIKISAFADFSIMNHPVHIVTRDNRTSPSSFIPFCEFGGDMSVVGVNLDQFDVPVCNSFKAKINNDQLCYEVDLNRFSNKSNIAEELELGFNFFMDYNEDRQVIRQSTVGKEEKSGISANLLESDKNQHAFIYLDTIGKEQPKIKSDDCERFLLFIEPVSLIGEGEYNLNVLKEIKATDSFLGLDQDVRKCQNDEPLFNCTTRKFIKDILTECSCLPSNLRISNKVRQIKTRIT